MPTNPEALMSLALEHHQAGRLPIAEQMYREFLNSWPEHPEALHRLGALAHQSGRHEMAIDCIRSAIRFNGTEPSYHNNLGEAHRALGQFPQAIACYQRALELRPEYSRACNNCGIALQEQGRFAEAVACYQRAMQMDPGQADSPNNLGCLLTIQGRFAEAIHCLQQALTLQPRFAEAHYNLGNALLGQRRYAEAAACYQSALTLKPDFARACLGLGNIRKDQGRPVEAIGCYRSAVDLAPDYPLAWGELVHQLQQICQWEDLPALSQRALAAFEAQAAGGFRETMTPGSVVALPTASTAQQQFLAAVRWVNQRLSWTINSASGRSTHAPRGTRDSRRTIGYLSADFRAHPVAFLLAELIEKHDRDRFEILGYSYGPDDGSSIRQRLMQAFDRFVDFKDVSPAEAAEQIARDQVDILVDLTGYTGNGRTEILAMRPAPVQVNYLGYPGTLGAPFMDYILVDDFVVPADRQPFFSEKLVHLPDCFMVHDSQREISSQTPSRAECGLPETGFVFCSFNNSFKITPEVFDVWMDLLRELPGSVLWLSGGKALVTGNLRREAAARGVAEDRLVFAPRLPAMADHLARYRVADLFLDTFPYNAHATASDALWAGCPVLTRIGETFPSRVAGSLLRTIGLPELITTGLDEYRELALRLARDNGLLAALRNRLQTNRTQSPLFDSTRFARHIEQAYATIWDIHCRGDVPQAFAVEDGPQ